MVINTQQIKSGERFMEQDSQRESLEVLDSQIREAYGRVVYAHKTHEKCADNCLYWQRIIKNVQIWLSAITSGVLIYAIWGDTKVATIVCAVLSTIFAIVTAYTKDYDFGTIAEKHRETAIEIWAIRESYLSLIADIQIGDLPLELVRQRREQLVADLKTVYKGCPATDAKGYLLAQKALKEAEDMTFSQEELNKILPEALRKKTPKNS
jgi:hypothetical protein